MGQCKIDIDIRLKMANLDEILNQISSGMGEDEKDFRKRPGDSPAVVRPARLFITRRSRL